MWFASFCTIGQSRDLCTCACHQRLGNCRSRSYPSRKSTRRLLKPEESRCRSEHVGSEVEKPLPETHTRQASEIAFTEGDEPGEHHDEVGRQVVRLQLVEIEKDPEELA